MRIDNFTTEPQPEPFAAQLAGFERLEQMLRDIEQDTRAIVLDFDLDVVIDMPQTDPHPPLPVVAVGGGLDGVANQVHQHLLELQAIRCDLRRGPQVNAEGYAERPRLFAVVAASAFATPDQNPPWFPSLMAFEHYDSERTHLFEQARLGGSYSGGSSRVTRLADAVYPSGYNMVYLNPHEVYLYGGGHGNIPNSTGRS